MLLTVIAVGVFVLTRLSQKEPVRYRSIATVQVAPKPAKEKTKKTSKSNTATTAPANIVVSGPQKLALSKPVREAALRLSHDALNDKRFRMTARADSTQGTLMFSVVAPTRTQATTLARNWTEAFVRARRLDEKRAAARSRDQLSAHVTALHDELNKIDAILVKLMPVVYRGILRYDAPTGAALASNARKNGASGPPPVPENANPAALNLALEREQLLGDITVSGERLAAIRVTNAQPKVLADLVAQTPATRVSTTRSTTIPAGAGLFGGLLLALAAALLADRTDRTIRDPEVAAAAFSAPVLSLIPAEGHDDFEVLEAPYSASAEAYRGLAATSIATDRLPRAIMVSTPYGYAHEEVAANYAAALSRLGLKVALVATAPEQSWYARRVSARNGSATFPELLTLAHSGALNGNIRDHLLPTEDAPNLVVVPPQDEPAFHLPVDGLPRLLEALSDAGIDVTVIAGPPLLEEPEATIVAWATRSVLWAIFPGEITQVQARAAAARLQLSGVTPFGVVMVGRSPVGV